MYPLGNLVGSFEMNSGLSFKKYPLGTLVGTFQKNSPHTCWVMTGQIASKLTTNSQCTHWVSDPLPPVTAGLMSDKGEALGGNRPGFRTPRIRYSFVIGHTEATLYRSHRSHAPKRHDRRQIVWNYFLDLDPHALGNPKEIPQTALQ